MKLNIEKTGISEESILSLNTEMVIADEALKAGVDGFNGWLSLPEDYDREEFARVKQAAEKIRSDCEVLVVVGIGGSYLGAKACIEMMGHSFTQLLTKEERKAPLVVFAGQNISPVYHSELFEVIKDRDICVCVISKSGTTTEPNIAFSLLKEILYDKYGAEGARSRIYAITDASKGSLREEADREGYESFVVPDDIGGRYSVLTPVGLLPIAAAGIDIKEILRGAADAMNEYSGVDLKTNPCARYAAARQLLDESGKAVEIYEFYEPKLFYFGEWLKQLFGESEGKEGRGLLPVLLQFSSDLHSMGQFIQEGSQIFFETVINVLETERDLVIPDSAAPQLRGKTMGRVNQAAVSGVCEAHAEDGIPIIQIDVPKLNEYYFGKMVYFFERSCALKGYLMGVNPFNQPGVEKYKAYMKEALNEQGI